ncbi:MAG: hypothetical protein AAB536_03660 [Patescibacteria group bacterium]
MRFNDSLTKLAEVGSKICLAAARAIANPGGASDEVRLQVGIEIDKTVENLRSLQVELEQIGQKNR